MLISCPDLQIYVGVRYGVKYGVKYGAVAAMSSGDSGGIAYKERSASLVGTRVARNAGTAMHAPRTTMTMTDMNP